MGMQSGLGQPGMGMLGQVAPGMDPLSYQQQLAAAGALLDPSLVGLLPPGVSLLGASMLPPSQFAYGTPFTNNLLAQTVKPEALAMISNPLLNAQLLPPNMSLSLPMMPAPNMRQPHQIHQAAPHQPRGQALPPLGQPLGAPPPADNVLQRAAAATAAIAQRTAAKPPAQQQARTLKAPPKLQVDPALPFPLKLYRMLTDLEANGNEHIASFTPSGKAFRIHDRRAFLTEIAPQYFRIQKYNSFKRQLYLYDFTAVPDGLDAGAHMHPSFRRGDAAAAATIRRTVGGYVERKLKSSSSSK